MAPIYGIDAILKRASKETVDKRCLHGGFLHTLSRSKADAAFWCPFVINILLLLLSSYFFGKDKAARHQGAEKRKLEWTAMQQTEDDEDEVYKECRTTHTRALWTALVSFSVGVILIIIMVEAGLTLQYCHNEELITFYWSFFSVIQLGSVIANLGIFLSELYLYSGQQHPAWNTALGTPILVLLSLVDLAGKLFKDKVLPSNSSSSEVGRIPLIGYQIEGDDDVRFCFRDRIPEAAVTVIALPDSMSYLRVAPVVQKEMTRESVAP